MYLYSMVVEKYKNLEFCMEVKLFVHIPKTAGKSVFECIDDDWNRSFPMNHDPYFHLQRTNE